MKLKLLSAILVIGVLTSCQNDFDKKSYEEQKLTVAQKEQNNPLEFLKIHGDNKKNLFGITVIKGTIQNTATICPYADIRIKILSYKNGVQVEEHEDVQEGTLKPGNSMDFKIKYHLPKGTDSVGLSIMNAHPVADSFER